MKILKIRSLSRLWCLPPWLKLIFTNHKNRWSKKLPDDVLQLILQRLPLSDYFNCRDVCRSWRTGIDSKRCLPASQLPWLLLKSLHILYIKDDCFVSDRRIYELYKCRTCYWPGCVGSIEGWLIIMSSGHGHHPLHQFFLLNPISGAQIILPSHSAPNVYSRKKAVASSVPTKTRTSQRRRCYVSFLHFGEEGRLAFCAPADKSWTFIEAKMDLRLGDIEIVDGKLYALGRHPLEFLIVFDIQLDSNGVGFHTYTRQKLITLYPNVEGLIDNRYLVYHSEVDNRSVFRSFYLARGSDESKDLFMILHDGEYFPSKTKGFQVLKLENNVTTGPQWVEIVDLGDQVLFVGGINNKFISSGSISYDQILERNSIYFFFDRHGCESGVFSLTNRGVKPLDIPNKEQLHTGLNNPLWFTPNPCI